MSRYVIRLQPGSITRDAPACLLRYGSEELRLAPGEYVVGRAASCHIVLDDPLVSRRHAKIIVRRGGTTIEDLGSSNGVYHNGEKIGVAPRDLDDGDVVYVGHDEIEVHLGDVAKKARLWTPSLESLKEDVLSPASPVVAEAESERPRAPAAAPEPNATDRLDALEMLGRIAEKSLALGRAHEAERMLAGHLANVLADARTGKGVLARSLEAASRFALKLASGTGDGRWFDYLIELYEAAGEPCPDSTIVELQVALSKVDRVDIPAFERLVGTLQGNAGDVERTRLVQRMAEVLDMAKVRWS